MRTEAQPFSLLCRPRLRGIHELAQPSCNTRRVSPNELDARRLMMLSVTDQQRIGASGDAAAIDRAALQTDMSALGRFLITKKEADIASFKTPGLRNLLMTGPYFHDGSQETLWDVLDHYNKGDGIQNPWLDQDMQPLALTEKDIDDVIAFLASLTSEDYKQPAAKELARQRALSRTTRPQRDTARAFGPKPTQPKPSRP